jgi:hypothetical protein
MTRQVTNLAAKDDESAKKVAKRAKTTKGMLNGLSVVQHVVKQMSIASRKSERLRERTGVVCAKNRKLLPLRRR